MEISNNIIGVIVTISGFALGIKIGANPWILALPGAMLTAIIWYYPKLKDEIKKGRIDREISITASRLGMLFSVGIGFIEAIKDVSRTDSEIGKEFRYVLEETERGVPVPMALEHSAKRIDSRIYTKLINQLILEYKLGNNADNILRLSKSISESQHMEMRKYSNNVSMYSMLLVTLSAILPAMFLSYLLMGSMFMKLSIGSMDALIIPGILFPLIDVALIGIIQIKKPRFTW